MASVFDDVTAARTGVLDRVTSGTPVAPEENEAINQIAANRMGEFTKGLRRAAYSAGAATDAFVGGLAESVAPDFAARQFQKAQNTLQNQPDYLRPAVESYRDVNDVGSAAKYAAGSLGEATTSIAGMVAAGLAARFGLGSALRLGAAGKNIAQYGGSMAAMLPQEAGETALSLRNNPEAMANTTPLERTGLMLGRGTVNAALESIVPNALLTNAIAGTARRIAPGIAPALTNVGRKVAAGTLGEGATEGAQELTGQYVENIAVPGTGYDAERVKEAAVRGAIAGSVLGGAGGTIQAVRSNLEAGAEKAAEKTAEGTNRGLNAAVEKLDYVIRNPQEFGQDLTNTTMGALSEVASRARDVGGAVADAAGPAAGQGMDAIAAFKRQFDVAVVNQLTPENTKKYAELTKHLRLLKPTEFIVLRDALNTGDPDGINKAVGAVSRLLTERVPRETFEGLKNLSSWAKKFGKGVTNAAREGRKASQSYSPKDINKFRKFLQEEYPQVLQAMDSTDDNETISRALMWYRDKRPVVGPVVGPKGPLQARPLTAVETKKIVDDARGSNKIAKALLRMRDTPSLAAAGEPEQYRAVLNDEAVESFFANGLGVSVVELLERAKARRNDETTRAEQRALLEQGRQFSGSGNRAAEGAEKYQTPAVQAQQAEEGRDVGPRIPGAVYNDEGQRVDLDDPRRTPYSSLKQVQGLIAADMYDGKVIIDANKRHDPTVVLPSTLSSPDISPEQIGQLLGGKNSVKGPDGKYRPESIGIAPETIDYRIERDEAGNAVGYRQDFNSVDIARQTGTPIAKGGYKENYAKFVEDFNSPHGDLNLQGRRFIAAITTLNSNGIDIPRTDVPAELLASWGMDVNGPDIHIEVNMPLKDLSDDLKIQVGDKETTLGDLNSANRVARSLTSQLALLHTILNEPLTYARTPYTTLLDPTLVGVNEKTKSALMKGMLNFAARQSKKNKFLYSVDWRAADEAADAAAVIDRYAGAYEQYLITRIEDIETSAKGRANQNALYNGLTDELYTPEDVDTTVEALQNSDVDDIEAAAAQWEGIKEWAATVGVTFTDAADLTDTLTYFQENGMDNWIVRAEERNQEVNTDLTARTTPDEEFRTRGDKTETNLRKAGIHKQNDAAVRRSNPMTVAHVRNMQAVLPEPIRAAYEDRILRDEDQRGDQLAFDFPFTSPDGRHEFLSLEHAAKSYGYPKEKNSWAGEFNPKVHAAFKREHDAAQTELAELQAARDARIGPGRIELQRAEGKADAAQKAELERVLPLPPRSEREPAATYPVQKLDGTITPARAGWSRALANALKEAQTLEEVDAVQKTFVERAKGDREGIEGINKTVRERWEELKNPKAKSVVTKQREKAAPAPKPEKPGGVVVRQKGETIPQARARAMGQQPQAPVAEPLNVWAGTNENAELSNLAFRPFTHDGREYLSVEHAYQSLKTGAFDQKTYDKYKNQLAKNGTLGKIRGGRADIKDGANVQLMSVLMQESFEQNPDVLETLRATGDRPITHTQDKGIWKTAFPRILMKIRSVAKTKTATGAVKQPQQAPTDADAAKIKALEEAEELFGLGPKDKAELDALQKKTRSVVKNVRETAAPTAKLEGESQKDYIARMKAHFAAKQAAVPAPVEPKQVEPTIEQNGTIQSVKSQPWEGGQLSETDTHTLEEITTSMDGVAYVVRNKKNGQESIVQIDRKGKLSVQLVTPDDAPAAPITDIDFDQLKGVLSGEIISAMKTIQRNITRDDYGIETLERDAFRFLQKTKRSAVTKQREKATPAPKTEKPGVLKRGKDETDAEWQARFNAAKRQQPAAVPQQQQPDALTPELRARATENVGKIVSDAALDAAEAAVREAISGGTINNADATFLTDTIAARRAVLRSAPLDPYTQKIISGELVSEKTSFLGRIAENWSQKYLDGANVQVVEYDAGAADVKAFFKHWSQESDRYNGMAFAPNFFAPNTPATLMIAKINEKKAKAGPKYGRMHTFAHEFGHIIEFLAYENAPQEVRSGIERAYQRDVMDVLSGGDEARAMRNASSVNRFLLTKQTGLTGTESAEELIGSIAEGINYWQQDGSAPYILDTREYFAEQFAKYAMNEPSVFAGEDTEVRSYLDKLIKKLKTFYYEIVKKLDKTAPEFDTFMKWLGTPAAERPPFPDYDPQQWDARDEEGTQDEGPPPPPPPEEGTTDTPPPERQKGETNADYVRRVGGKPPAPPTTPPRGPQRPTPPPPDNDAQKKFRAIIEKLLGKRVDIEFGVETLGEGVGGEYVPRYGQDLEDTGKALSAVNEKRREELRALEKRRAATEEDIAEGKVDPRTPEQIKASVRELEAKADRYRADLAVRGTIRVASGMEAQAGLAEHEAFHAAFAFFFGENNAADRKAIVTAFTQGVVARRLQNYFRNNAEVLAVIDPTSKTFRAEEAAAYGFQVFIHDPGALQLGQKVEGIFNRFLAYLRNLVGYKTYEERAQTILDDFASGKRSERGVSVLRENPSIERSMLERSQNFVKEIGTGVMHLYDAILTSSYSRLADSGNPAMAQIARLGHNATGETGHGMIELQRLHTTQFSNQMKDALHALDADELHDLGQAMLLNEPLPAGTKLGEAQKKMRALYAEAHKYQKDAGINLGFKDNYYPMIWSPDKVAADPQGFIKMLENYPAQMDELKITPTELRDSILAWEERGHEFQGIFGKDGEPVADSSRRMSLSFITNEDRLKFMEDNIIDTTAHYLNQSVRHAEYVRAFGENANTLKQLIGEIKGTYGGTQADVNLAQDYIDGLMGNKEVGMSRELKDLYGAAIVYQNIRLLPLTTFSSLVDPLGIGVRTQSATAVFDTFAYSIRNLFTDFRNKTNWTPEQWEKYAGDVGTVDMSGTVKSIDKIFTGVTLRGKTREINDGFFKWNLLNGLVKNHHIMATKYAQMYLRRSAEGMFGEKDSAENLQEAGVSQSDIVYDEKLGRIKTFSYEFLGYEDAATMEREASKEEIEEARAQADRIQQAIHKIVRQSLIQPSSAIAPGWMSNPYLAPIAHLKTFVFGFNATILQRLMYEAKRGNYSPMYYAAAYVPGMIAADFLKGLAGNGGDEPEWKKNWGVEDYLWHGVQRSGLTGTGQFFIDMNNDVTRGGGGWENLSGPTIEQAHDLMRAMSAKTSEPTATWMTNALPANDLYDQWLAP